MHLKNYFFQSPIHLIVVTTLLVVGNSCSATPKEADWLVNDPAQYPTKSFLLGRGQARSLESAKDRARADIAKQFRVDISATTSSRTDVNATINSKGRQEAVNEKLSSAIESKSEIALNGIEIVKTEKNDSAPDTQRYSVLAVLNKVKAASQLAQEIAQLDDSTRINLENEVKTPNEQGLTKIRLISNALMAQIEKNELEKLLQVVSTRPPPPATVSIAELRARIQTLKNGVTVKLMPPSDPVLIKAAKTALAQAGLIESDKGRYRVTVDASLNPVVAREGQFMAIANLSTRLESDGEFATSCQWVIRRVAGSETFAKTMLEKSINDTLIQFFNNVVTGQSMKECS